MDAGSVGEYLQMGKAGTGAIDWHSQGRYRLSTSSDGRLVLQRYHDDECVPVPDALGDEGKIRIMCNFSLTKAYLTSSCPGAPKQLPCGELFARKSGIMETAAMMDTLSGAGSISNPIVAHASVKAEQSLVSGATVTSSGAKRRRMLGKTRVVDSVDAQSSQQLAMASFKPSLPSSMNVPQHNKKGKGIGIASSAAKMLEQKHRPSVLVSE